MSAFLFFLPPRALPFFFSPIFFIVFCQIGYKDKDEICSKNQTQLDRLDLVSNSVIIMRKLCKQSVEDIINLIAKKIPPRRAVLQK